jgi:hypothetical protein
VHAERIIEILPCDILAVLEARWAFDALCHLDRAAPECQNDIVERVPRHVRDLICLKKNIKIIREFRAI